MILNTAYPIVKEYFKHNITRAYLHFDLRNSTFVCLTSVKLKKYYIPIMIVDSKTTEYEVLYFSSLVKQKWNLYEMSDIDPSIIQKECNGCGNKTLGKLIPEFVFAGCCNIHDIMYYYGGNKGNKKMSDNVFYFNMLRASNKKWHKAVAWVYHYFVRHFGKDSFNYK